MAEPANVPALAIHSFERLTGLAISIHDQSRELWSWLPPDRFEHFNPFCRVVKKVRQPACTAFDSQLVYQHAAEQADGLVKVCHAGFVEWVVPNLAGDRLRWVLFAGVRRPAPGLEHVLRDPSPLRHGGPWSAKLASLPAVDDGEALFILEALRQLNLRLESWRANRAPPSHHELPRAEKIRNFLIRHHTRPDLSLADLAAHLELSDSRTGHAVRDSCNTTFISLLTDIRLRTAAGLLRHSDLPLTRIIADAGFGNRAHFHALFRAAFGTTPGRYRRQVA